MVRPRAQALKLKDPLHIALLLGIQRAVQLHILSAHPGVEADAAAGKALRLSCAGLLHPGPDRRRGFIFRLSDQVLIAQRRRLYTKIHAVQQRAADPLQISGDLRIRAVAAVAVRIVAAAAGIHRRHQHHIGWKAVGALHPRDMHLSILQGLS